VQFTTATFNRKAIWHLFKLEQLIQIEGMVEEKSNIKSLDVGFIVHIFCID
jgi:hypothetical protein